MNQVFYSTEQIPLNESVQKFWLKQENIMSFCNNKREVQDFSKIKINNLTFNKLFIFFF